MKFFEPNEKRTTVAVYTFIVAIFAVLCVMIGINVSFVGKVFGYIYEVIKPIVYGFVIAFLLHPMVRFTEEKVLGHKKETRVGFRHLISVVIVYVFIILVFLLFIAAIYPEISSNYSEFTKNLFEYIESFRNSTAEFINSTTNGENIYVYSNLDPQLRVNPSEGVLGLTIKNLDGIGYSASSSSVKQAVFGFFDGFLTSAGEWVKGVGFSLFTHLGTVVSETTNILLGVVLSLYFMLGEHKLCSGISHIAKSWLPTKLYGYVAWLTNKAKNIFRDYIVVRVLDGLIVSSILFVCLFIFGTPFSALIALIVGVTSFFPFIGPMLGIAIGVLLLIVVDIKYAILFLVISVILNLLDSKYVEPFLHAGRNQHKLAASWVFIAIVLMGGLFGVMGILIGIPLFAFFYAIVKDICERRLRAKECPVETYHYYERDNVASEAEGVKEGTDVVTYFAEKRDDEEICDEIREKIADSTGSVRKFFRRLFGRNKKK